MLQSVRKASMYSLLLLLTGLQVSAGEESALLITIADVVDKSAEAGETVLTNEDFEAVPAEEVDLTRIGIDVKPDPTMGSRTEGDIAIENVKKFVEDSNKLGRNAIRQTYRRWPNAEVPYTLSTQYGAYSRSIIAKAMQEYHDKTCIRFVPRNANRHKDYVYIHPDDGCYSLVGRTGGRQPLSLDSGCIQTGTIVHELMHAVGFFHEQSRADRDYYIEIIWQNVLRGANDQFEKYGLNVLDHLNEPYDYASIMHYGAYAFSDNGKRTIIARQPGSERMGQRVAFTDIDLRKLNKLYGCPQGRNLVSNSINDAVPKSQFRGSTKPAVPAPLPPRTPEEEEEACEDKDWRCKLWSLSLFGRCVEFEIAERICRKACGSCSTETIPPTTNEPQSTTTSLPTSSTTDLKRSVCRDLGSSCPTWSSRGHCTSRYHSRFMHVFCPRSCGFCDDDSDTSGEHDNHLPRVVVDTVTEAPRPAPPSVCADTDGFFKCAAVEILGKCEENENNCAKTCGFCA